jgi:hypothetical protein
MATVRFDNPFHDLWVTEILDPGQYVRMFSPLLVSDAEALFSKGHVILKGRQGSGKSMLLNLLETTTRVAYIKKNVRYPVPKEHRRFISAGIQLTQQNAAIVAARAIEIPDEKRAQTLAINFSDYVNCLLCLDLLKNIRYLHKEQSANREVIEEVPVDLSEPTQAIFLTALFEIDSWKGFVNSQCSSVDQVIKDLEGRIRVHRNFGNTNIDELPTELEESRTIIGEPMAGLATALRDSGILPEETLVFLRIDQHEELFELERKNNLGNIFRQVINSALARRDPSVAYRLGTRHYAWEADLTSWISGAPLDNLRDYSVVDLDSILKRGEHTKGWKFPAFAKDVVDKRLLESGFKVSNNSLLTLFGKSLEPSEKAKKYVKESEPLLSLDDAWHEDWKKYLTNLWYEDPLEAKLGEAWLRQQLQVRSRVARDGTLAHGHPWRSKPWWVKERNEIALMQLAGMRRQALIWSGDRQIIDLAGYNILAFMTVCKSIWSTWQRRNPSDADVRGTLPEFSLEDQVIGITEASQTWFKKIQVGLEADQRAQLISCLAGWFRRRMLADQAMSYPGHSGVSLLESDLTSKAEVISIIKVCRDHGDLLEANHTTKNKDQAPRIKWYIHPLLCPLFRIPHVRTKEPIYTTPSEVQGLYLNQKRAGPQPDETGRGLVEVQTEFPGM